MEWIKALEKLDEGNVFTSVKLKIDNHNVTYCNKLIDRELVIMWYCDGWWKGEYVNKENEIGQKFGKPQYYGCPKESYNLELALNGKKAADKYREELRKRIMMYDYKWNNAAELIKHLKKNFAKIEVIHEPAS